MRDETNKMETKKNQKGSIKLRAISSKDKIDKPLSRLKKRLI